MKTFKQYVVEGVEQDNWDAFKEYFMIDDQNMKQMAQDFGYNNKRDLEISLYPIALYKKDKEKFKAAVQRYGEFEELKFDNWVSENIPEYPIESKK